VDNLFKTYEPIDFYIWVDTENWLVKYHLQHINQFFSGGLVGEKNTNLMFIPNPEFKGRDVSVFHQGLLWNYLPEYNLELSRLKDFTEYPSRLNALYLFPTEENAQKYAQLHPEHISGRVMMKCKSKGSCLYSIHDLGWIDFLRNSLMIDDKSMDNIAKSYWSGVKVIDCKLESLGKPWTQEPITEVLLIGVVEFYNHSIS